MPKPSWVIVGGGNEGGGGGHRTILLKNLAIRNDTGDHLDVYGGGGTCSLVTGILRKPLEEDLTLRVKLYDGTDGSLIDTVGEFTIPADTDINVVIEFTDEIDFADFPDKAVFVWDVTESDEQFDGAGVAAFTVFWS